MEAAAVSDEVTIEDRIIAHLGLARAIAARTVDPRCAGADREDLIAWGLVGLVQAAQRYRPTEGASFGGYAARRVRGQVLDALRARDPLTRSARRAYRAERALHEDLPPPYLEVSLERVMAAGREPPDRGSPQASPDPRWPDALRALRRLPPVERRVLALSFGRGLTLREVGQRVGLSESGVCRMRARALERVRELMRVRSQAGPLRAARATRARQPAA